VVEAGRWKSGGREAVPGGGDHQVRSLRLAHRRPSLDRRRWRGRRRRRWWTRGRRVRRRRRRWPPSLAKDDLDRQGRGEDVDLRSLLGVGDQKPTGAVLGRPDNERRLGNGG